MFVYISADDPVLSRETTSLLSVLSVIFRCSTEALTVKHVVRVWLSHHVCERGSLCEHDLIFCCIMEKALSILSALMTAVVMILFVWTRPWWGKNEAGKFSPVWYLIVWWIRGEPSRITEICAEPKHVSEEEKSSPSPFFCLLSKVVVMKHRQWSEISEEVRDGTVVLREDNCKFKMFFFFFF